MKVVAAICLGLAVAAFLLHAISFKLGNISLAWLGVTFLAAGIYFVPVAYVAFG